GAWDCATPYLVLEACCFVELTRGEATGQAGLGPWGRSGLRQGTCLLAASTVYACAGPRSPTGGLGRVLMSMPCATLGPSVGCPCTPGLVSATAGRNTSPRPRSAAPRRPYLKIPVKIGWDERPFFGRVIHV